MTPRTLARGLLYALPLAFLAIFFFYPLGRIFQISFRSAGEGDISGLFTGGYFWRLLWFTTWQAAVSTLLTLLVGLPLAFLFARYEFRGKTLLRALTTIPFVLPTVVVAVAFAALLGPNGVLNQWAQAWFNLDAPPIRLQQTIWAILIAHTFYNVSIIIRTVGGFWANLNPRLDEAAAMLGAGSWARLRHITLPLLLPSILAASLLIFLFCFTSFGVILILGGLRFATLEVEIYRQAQTLFNLPAAAILSLIQMACTFAVMALYTRLQARASLPLEQRPQSATARPPRTWGDKLALGFGMAFILLILLSPLLALIWRSVSLGDQGLTWAYYAELSVNRRQSAFFAPPVVAIRNSLFFAAQTVVLSLILGIISAYLLAQPRRWTTALLEPIFLLPLGASAVTLGFGYIVSMGSLRTSPLLIPIAHTLIAAPFVIRTFLPALRSLDPRLRQAAATLGASPARVWWEVDAPLLGRAVLVCAAFSFTISLGEFGATLLISRPDLPTMPVVIYKALSQPGLLNFGQALAMSTILMLTSAIGLVAIERFRLNDIGEF
ncbi:MAG: iron ABC transporter permease [Caldilineaceae bacterium]|nr:iron ABC transporter permease [Caldilineaceae bacterium]